MAKKRKSSSRSEKGFVIVGRFDDSKRVEVSKSTSIGEALALGGYGIGGNEKIQDTDCNELQVSDKVVFGKAYYLTQSVKSA